MNIQQCLLLNLVSTLFSLGLVSAARAEAPMVTDDAGTLDPGAKKLEGAFNKAGRARGLGGGMGFSPLENLELGATLAHTRDRSVPVTANATGLSAKWIPFKTGSLSAGLKLDLAHARAAGASTNATTLTGLATWRAEKGPVIHVNLGRTAMTGANTSNWGLGVELPLAENVQLTAETYGSSGNKPGQQLGVRWEVQQGLKVSAALGRNAAQSMVFTGFSWEF